MPRQLDVDRAAMPYAARRNHWNNHVERHGFAVPDRPAFRFRGRTTTWRQLRDRVRALADALNRRGVSSGDRVAVLMGNRPEFMETVLAANRLGAVAVPLNFRLTGSKAAYILGDSGARLLVVDDLAAGVGRDAVASAAEPPRTVVVGGAGLAGAESYEALIAEAGDPAPSVDVPEDTPALIMYTSGTTGRPKGAVLTHQNLQGQALTIIRAFQLHGEGEVNLVAAPMFHIGAIGSIVPLILLGGTLVVLPSGAFDSGHVLGLLEDELRQRIRQAPPAD